VEQAATMTSPAEACGCGDGCTDACCVAPPPVRDARWLRAAQVARRLAWASLVWMALEGVVGLVAGVRAGSVSLLGWALSSVVEGLASVVVIWRFSGSRTLSDTSERRAQKAVAVSFWLLAPYIALDSVHALIRGERPGVSVLGMVLTASSVVIMPILGRAKQHLGARLESGATTGEGRQNWLCAATGGAVLIGLIANAAVWRGEDCC
jgi:divalent metal cation (Fe/Co/Zn/Cd) transporter